METLLYYPTWLVRKLHDVEDMNIMEKTIQKDN